MELNELIAFVAESDGGALEVRVNFGMFAGREATSAEVEELGQRLLREVGAVTVVSEERHEMSADREVSVHQVRVTVAPDEVFDSALQGEHLSSRVVELTEEWARECFAARHAEHTEG